MDNSILISEKLDDNLLQIMAMVKQYLKQIYQENLESVILFGSRARGDAKPDSDIDLLIILKNPFDYSQEIEKTSHFISELCLENNLVISRSFVNSQTYRSAVSPFFRNVRREGIVL
jgi:predicted nucleotidyltransferase